MTGYDVITFGRSGASNAKGWVREPLSKYRYIHDVIDSDLQPPRFILAFFYAGNDLSDNFLQVRDRFIPAYGEAAVHDDAATKLIWLALRNITEDWGRAVNNWKSAMNQFAILYEDRFTKSNT